MIPEFTQSIFLKSLEEWGACPSRYNALSPEEQAGYLKRQGFASLHDVLAHVGVWWEEAHGIIRDTLDGVERQRRKYDFDEFNADSLARFRDTSGDAFMRWYEAERQKMVDLVTSLDAGQLKIRRVHGWLDAVTLFHLKEHGVGAPRFLILDMLQREWAGYVERLHALNENEQKVFLHKQGFARLRDLVAHVAAWWDEGLQLIDGVSKDPSYRMPDRDVNAYNAEILLLFAPLDEADVWKKYESTRAALIELLINLPDETYEHRQVQAWLKSDVIEHYFDHAV